jgi:hypothetical protein
MHLPIDKLSGVFQKIKERMAQDASPTSMDQNDFPAASDDDIESIRKELEVEHPVWARSPRLYTVMRLIDRLNIMDDLVSKGYLDANLPLSDAMLSNVLDLSTKEKFLHTQHVVLTPGMRVENGGFIRATFDILGFEVQERLHPMVWIVESSHSGVNYTFKRRILNESYGSCMESVAKLKCFEHPHLATFVGNILEPHHVIDGNDLDDHLSSYKLGMLYSPAATDLLNVYMREIIDRHADTDKLNTFFDALASAFEYLHRFESPSFEISTSNIIVHDHKPMFLDVTSGYVKKSLADLVVGRSTTTNWRRRTTHGPLEMYKIERNYYDFDKKYDSRSCVMRLLGVLFLDIYAALQHKHLAQIYFSVVNSSHHSQANIWDTVCNRLESEEITTPSSQTLLQCIKRMLGVGGRKQPTPDELIEEIRKYSGSSDGSKQSSCFQCSLRNNQSESLSPSSSSTITAPQSRSNPVLDFRVRKASQPLPRKRTVSMRESIKKNFSERKDK